MHPFRKKTSSSSTPPRSRSLTPAPPAEYVKRQLATFYPREKDSRALVASSSAIALCFVSPSCDPNDATPDEASSSRESSWRTVYGAARMVVETAKESSDMCPPLKAVVGVLSVLIKNYDQTIANVSQIEDIEGMIQSLGDVLASPVGEQDAEEKARREVLRKKLAGIMAGLEPLSERHGFMKFLNNADHADTLNGFVQDLAFAVTDYQTSLQQSIYANTKGIDEVRNDTRKINETTTRTDEAARRTEEAARKINDTTSRTDETAMRTDETTRRIDEATKELDQKAQTIIEAAELDILAKLDPVHNAGYQAGHHDMCLRGTRESVLDGIIGWAKDSRERPVFWLNGLAGTGKSTIAQTFSQMVAEDGTLGASFFCSRDYLNRRELKHIFPTLAHQLACRYPSFRSQIVGTVKKDPSVARGSLISQLQDLIINPLSSTNISCVIVIDALDECTDDQPASAILSVLGRYAKQLSSVKLFITGRPEPRIRRGFRLPLLVPLTEIFLLHGVKLSSVDGDIRLYLQEKLNAIAKLRSGLGLSNPWPCHDDLNALTKKSQGLFIFASTLARFIDSEHYEPAERLRLIVNSPDSTAHEGRAGIDSLYTQVLTHAFSGVKDTTVFANFRRVLGAVVNAFNPLSQIQIAEILGITLSLITTTLQHLHSVLLIPSEASEDVRIFHKSFPDFLQDSSRCSDSEFFIDSAVHHADMALSCLELLGKLKPNPCDLPDFVMNRDVADLPQLLEDRLGNATRYACWYWAMHLRSSPTTEDRATQLVASATEFFKNNAVPWIEVMSLENQLEGVIYGIYGLLDWIAMAEVPTSDLRSQAQDCLRFTMYFFHLIQQSARHMYHSALPLSPKSSTFHSVVNLKTAVAGFHGRPDTWGAVMRTIRPSSGRFTSMTTIGHRIAAVCNESAVEIYDSITGALRLSLTPADPVQAVKGSTDGSMLFCVHRGPSISVWDIQTGGLVHTLTLDGGAGEIAICLEGRYIAYGLSDGSIKIREVLDNTESAAFGSGSPVTHLCWLESGKQLVVARGVSAQVWDVVARQVLRSPARQGRICGVVYAPKLNKFATVATSETECIVTVIDSRTGTSFTNRTRQRISCFAFSLITEELVCGMDTPGLELLNVQARDWRQFNHPATISSISTLSNGTVVADVVDSGIQFLSLDEGYSPPQKAITSGLAVYTLDQGNIVAFISTSHDHITLLESSTISPLLTIPTPGTLDAIPIDNPANNNVFPALSTIPTPGTRDAIPINNHAILCTSLEHRVAIHRFETTNETSFLLWRFGSERPEWTGNITTNTSRGCFEFGGISPGGSMLVVLSEVGRKIHVYIWDVQNEILPYYRTITEHPHTPLLGVEFESEERLYFQHDTYRTLHDFHVTHYLGPPYPGDIPDIDDIPDMEETDLEETDLEETDLEETELEETELEETELEETELEETELEETELEDTPNSEDTPADLNVRFKKLDLPGKSGEGYNVNSTREWVIRSSKRICWIPPGYIGSSDNSHCWAGRTLFMVGHDGVLRTFTFRAPQYFGDI